MLRLAALVVAAGLLPAGHALDNGLAITPPMVRAGQPLAPLCKLHPLSLPSQRHLFLTARLGGVTGGGPAVVARRRQGWNRACTCCRALPYQHPMWRIHHYSSAALPQR